MDDADYSSNLRPDPQLWDPVFFTAPRRPSAVAVIRFDGLGATPHILLIRRSTRLRSHKGQIGFPGGRLESGDQRPRDTALRETAEEVGLSPDQVQVLGGVDPVPALDGSLVYPIICRTSAALEDLRINRDEVSDIYMIPVDQLARTNQKRFGFNLFGCWRQSFLYDCGAISVWGLSAEILAKADFQVAR